MSKPNAWVTLATNDGYAIGALVLAHSLRKVATAHKIHIIYTDGVTPNMLHQLQSTFDDSTLVDVLDSKDEANLALIQRPDLGVTFTKLHCWLLTQYAKCVFLDADTLVIRNADELFERPEITAAPDMGWPDYFNSGVFVFEPSEETYHKLVQFGLQYGSFDGGDQGLLNLFFSNWRELDARHRLPLIYNLCASVVYTYMAALKRHGDQVKIVHFLGAQKPWLKGGPTPLPAFWALWFAIYDEKVRGTVPSDIEGPTSDERRQAWEQGRPDYQGRDAFENIMKAIEKSLS
uniref:glycogenin glucosyltransferase n=1 Tax=Acrobeloides nanus TaxID=290746 RepID=A0A914CKX8_9BILA